MAPKTKKSPIHTGTKILEERGPSGESVFLAIQADEAVEVVPMVSMDEMISVDQHAIWLDSGNSPIFPCIAGSGEDCPGCQLGTKPRFRGFLPVLTKEGPKIFSFGIQVARNLSEIDEATSGIGGQVLRIKRTGSGLSTRWTIITTGKKKDVAGKEAPDVIPHLGPTDRASIIKLLAQADGIDLNAVLTKKERAALDSDVEEEEVMAADDLEETEVVTEAGDDWDDV